VEADKTLKNKEELSDKELEELAAQGSGDSSNPHWDCLRQIKILKTQNYILEKRDVKHIARREEMAKQTQHWEDK